jgi:hypothetical protein
MRAEPEWAISPLAAGQSAGAASAMASTAMRYSAATA